MNIVDKVRALLRRVGEDGNYVDTGEADQASFEKQRLSPSER
jgi:hypothetical protein